MTTKRVLGTLSMLALLCAAPMVVWGCYGYRPLEEMKPADLAKTLVAFTCRANSVDAEGSYVRNVIRVLRTHRQAGLDAMVAQRASLPKALATAAKSKRPSNPNALAMFDQLVDRVAMQKFATSSRLFWHTSLDEAKVDAAAKGLPILSLRMLGHLDKELSCANSRFFRTVLYVDPAISKIMREQFVLHWAPVREVPLVTIDFGDGRQLKRPITGNSMHMLLDSNAKPLDALPGLVSPVAFRQWMVGDSLASGGDVGGAVALFAACKGKSQIDVSEILRQFHKSRADSRRSESDLAIQPDELVSQLNPLDQRWKQEAVRYQPVGLSIESNMLITNQQPAEVAMPLAIGKGIVETPVLRMVRNLQSSLSQDTAFNLYGLQPKVDDIFMTSGADVDLEQLVKQIYADVFLMPLDDPWLGLSPRDEFVAIRNLGRTLPVAQQSSLQPAGAPTTLDSAMRLPGSLVIDLEE